LYTLTIVHGSMKNLAPDDWYHNYASNGNYFFGKPCYT